MKIPGQVSKLITSLFADDTSVFLAKTDDHNTLFQILKDWCAASEAKFNLPDQLEILHTIKIANDGEPIRALGAFVGNHINEINIWTPTLEKCEQLFEKWSKMRPTIEGRCALVQLIAGGETQYKTRVQGMPADIEKHFTKLISKFIWDGGPPAVSRLIMRESHELGGKKLLDIVVRNEAIELMKLQRYLNLGPE
ncbi:hypothetical protein BDQ17DRAFT_1508254 [Cyathus striatus]|nr:hypothetical protein BDQ17DRAFT_1508254 [Cyathus striatus]